MCRICYARVAVEMRWFFCCWCESVWTSNQLMQTLKYFRLNFWLGFVFEIPFQLVFDVNTWESPLSQTKPAQYTLSLHVQCNNVIYRSKTILQVFHSSDVTNISHQLLLNLFICEEWKSNVNKEYCLQFHDSAHIRMTFWKKW